ncbi:hypothetical protein SMSP1_00061 [Sedimentisphaera salicampi]|nr:hypothetical protein SMSP1_00061 [Sedimentisphaera salicampi]
MTGHKIRLADKIWLSQKAFAEAKVRYCYSTGLLGIVNEVALGVVICE